MLVNVDVRDVTLESGDASLRIKVKDYEYRIFPNGRIERQITSTFDDVEELQPGTTTFERAGTDFLRVWNANYDANAHTDLRGFRAYQDLLSSDRIILDVSDRNVFMDELGRHKRQLRPRITGEINAFIEGEQLNNMFHAFRNTLLIGDRMQDIYWQTGKLVGFLGITWYPANLSDPRQVVLGSLTRVSQENVRLLTLSGEWPTD